MVVFLRDPSPYLREFRRKITENSKQLGRQARPEIEPGTSRLPVLSSEPLHHLWGSMTKGVMRILLHNCARSTSR